MSVLPLVAAQPGIFVADQLSSFGNAYVVVHYLELTGNVNLKVLLEAIKEGMEEVDTLKMDYTTDRRGDAIQILRNDAKVPDPEFLDLCKEIDPISVAKQIMDDDMQRNVRLGTGVPLVRHVVMQLSEDRYWWYQRYHHIQVDAFSFTALTRRMGTIYSSKVRGIDNNVEGVANGSSSQQSIKLAVEEYEEYLQSSKYKKDQEFWKSFCAELPDAVSVSPLPLAGVEPTKHIIRNHTILDGNEFSKLCSGQTVSQVDMALALLSTWLLRLSGHDEMTCGFIFMRRLGSKALNTSGPFINVIPLPLKINDSKATLVDVAKSIAQTMRKIRRHQKYDSEKIVRDSGKSWDTNPLFGPVINLKAFDYDLDFHEVNTVTHHVASGPIRDLEMVLYINDDGSIRVEYLANGDRYDSLTLDRHLNRLHQLLHQFTVNSDLPCQLADIVLPDEIEQFDSINKTEVKNVGSGALCLMELVDRQARKTPDAIALQDDSPEFTNGLTYANMMQEVYHLVDILRAHGVKPGDIVSVALNRTVLLSLAIQAVSAAGAIWLPLDVSYPPERLNLMVTDAKPRLILTSNTETTELIVGSDSSGLTFPSLVLDKLPSQMAKMTGSVHAPNTEGRSAYIIYTSGSTGKPKGVILTHDAIINRLEWMKSEYQIDSQDCILQKTSACFDVSVWEFFLPLISGARLVMAPQDSQRDPIEIQRLFTKFGVTTVHFVPSMLSTFLSQVENSDVWKSKLKRAFCSGEALPTNLAVKWENMVGAPLYNLYGPTEAAIDVTSYPAFGKHLPDSPHIPIGLPVWNTKVHVLDKNLQLLPEGVSGDLYLSGVQLAWGYLHRPELTGEKFIIHNGVRMYKTGDIARWLPKNRGLEFMGRVDDQVKLRGQRIELGEIDSVMETLDGVTKSTTLAVSNPKLAAADIDSRVIVSYIVGDAQEETVLHSLRNLLPAYMIPVKIVRLLELPISSSGKLDKRALPGAFDTPSENEMQHIKRQPMPGLEQEIADSYKEVLGLSYVSAEDDFFSLGGHSLMAVKLVSQLRSKIPLPVTIGQIMQHPRIDLLAKHLGDSHPNDWKTAGFEDVLNMGSADPGGNTIYCIHPASGFSWQFSVLRRYLDPKWKLVGIQSARKDGPLASADTLEEVIDDHFNTLLNLQSSETPYYLLGYSLGGTLAHSLAAMLEEAGRSVAFLGLLDTWPPETQNWDAKKDKREVDQAVVEEMQRERQQFMAASANGDSASKDMFDIIQTNYASAVRILATAESKKFGGKSTLFSAQKTLPTGTDLHEVWKPYTSRLEIVPVNSSHVDIVSPVVLATLGPQINEILRSVE